MKYSILIAFLFIVAGRSPRAQYENTDYKDNLSGGNLLVHFAIPCDGKVISRFGRRSGRMHTGTDIKMSKGDTIYAAFSGEASRSSFYYGYGNLVILQHGKNIETYYGHLSKLLVKKGEWVKKGEAVGLAGATGRATTSHLHFEIRENEKPYDAELVFDFENGNVRSEISNTESLAALFSPEAEPRSHSGGKPEGQDYIVRSGDSLWKISKRAKTSIHTLCQLNELTENSVLQVGQVIRVY